MRDRFAPLRQIPLPAVLRACGARPERYDKAKWHTAQGTISITGMKFMNWNQNRGGGGAIDLAMHLNPWRFRLPCAGWSGSFPSRLKLHPTRRRRAACLYRCQTPTGSPP
jgi:hypothetical protein